MISARPCIMSVDLDAITHNIELYKQETDKTIFGVVKANAYGHGDIMIARHLESLGVRMLCVSSLDEAVHLHKHGIRSDILIFGPTDPETIRVYHQTQFIYTITSKSYFSMFDDSLPPLRFHIEVNTGMNRLGFKTSDDIHDILQNTHHIFEGIYTHFSSADEPTDFTEHQYTQFEHCINELNYPFKWIHAGNSHGSLAHHDTLVNAERIGIGMYGYVDKGMFNDFSLNLRPAMRLDAKIVHIDTLEVGEPVGYNRTFYAQESMRFGTLPIGYADGLNPLNRNLPFKKESRDVPVLGKICMDQTMIQVATNDNVGDWIEIIGPNRSVAEIASITETIPYVVMSQLNDRITRQYLKSDNVVATINIQNS